VSGPDKADLRDCARRKFTWKVHLQGARLH
jgi:hypothetical protein